MSKKGNDSSVNNQFDRNLKMCLDNGAEFTEKEMSRLKSGDLYFLGSEPQISKRGHYENALRDFFESVPTKGKAPATVDDIKRHVHRQKISGSETLKKLLKLVEENCENEGTSENSEDDLINMFDGCKIIDKSGFERKGVVSDEHTQQDEEDDDSSSPMTLDNSDFDFLFENSGSDSSSDTEETDSSSEEDSGSDSSCFSKKSPPTASMDRVSPFDAFKYCTDVHIEHILDNPVSRSVHTSLVSECNIDFCERDKIEMDYLPLWVGLKGLFYHENIQTPSTFKKTLDSLKISLKKSQPATGFKYEHFPAKKFSIPKDVSERRKRDEEESFSTDILVVQSGFQEKSIMRGSFVDKKLEDMILTRIKTIMPRYKKTKQDSEKMSNSDLERERISSEIMEDAKNCFQEHLKETGISTQMERAALVDRTLFVNLVFKKANGGDQDFCDDSDNDSDVCEEDGDDHKRKEFFSIVGFFYSIGRNLTGRAEKLKNNIDEKTAFKK